MGDDQKTKAELVIELQELREKYKRLKKFFADTVGMKNLQGSETILVLDDNEPTREAVADMLGNFGYTALQAASSDAAVELINTYEKKIDLVLSDVVMPNDSGPEAVEKLVKLNPDLKVLFMSGYAGDEIVHDDVFELMHADHPLIMKPFSLVDIGILIKQQFI